jgi:hypothetical protein
MPTLPPPTGHTRVQCFIADELHKQGRIALAMDNSSWGELISLALTEYLAAHYPQIGKLATK